MSDDLKNHVLSIVHNLENPRVVTLCPGAPVWCVIQSARAFMKASDWPGHMEGTSPMTIRLKDRRKPWQKACMNFKFTMCGSMTKKTEAEQRRANKRQCSVLGMVTLNCAPQFDRYTDVHFHTIGGMERSGIIPDTPLRYRPMNILAIAAE